MPLHITIQATGASPEHIADLDVMNTDDGTPEWGRYYYHGMVLGRSVAGYIHAHNRQLGALRLVERILGAIGYKAARG